MEKGSSDNLSFAARLARRVGLRQVSLAVKDRAYDDVVAAKKRFGTLALARFLAVMCREVLILCRRADR